MKIPSLICMQTQSPEDFKDQRSRKGQKDWNVVRLSHEVYVHCTPIPQSRKKEAKTNTGETVGTKMMKDRLIVHGKKDSFAIRLSYRACESFPHVSSACLCILSFITPLLLQQLRKKKLASREYLRSCYTRLLIEMIDLYILNETHRRHLYKKPGGRQDSLTAASVHKVQFFFSPFSSPSMLRETYRRDD